MALIEVPAGSVHVRRERTLMIGIGKSLGHLKKTFRNLPIYGAHHTSKKQL